jgi:hypothetical protein
LEKWGARIVGVVRKHGADQRAKKEWRRAGEITVDRGKL